MFLGMHLHRADLVEPEFCSAGVMMDVPRAKRAEEVHGHPEWEQCVLPLPAQGK